MLFCPFLPFLLYRLLQPSRSAPEERDNEMVTRDPGWVTAILYSRLAMSLRSLAIILPIRLHLLSLTPTFGTLFYNYHMYTYEAERRHVCPYSPPRPRPQ